MIIDTSYFLLPPLFIPNAVEQPSIGLNTPNSISDLQAVIDSVEYDFLVNSLGFEQYTELKSQFNPDGTWIENPLQKWVDLVDGKDKWTGLRCTIGENKVSIIAYYVYYEFLAQNRQYFTTTGLVSLNDANAVKVNPAEELVDKWNKFVFMYQGDSNRYLNWWNPIFFEWNGYPYSGVTDNYTSYYGFMSENTLMYNTSFFKRYDVKNRFGL